MTRSSGSRTGNGGQTGTGGKHPRASLDELNERIIQRLVATSLMASSLERHVIDPFVRNRIREVVDSLDKVIADIRLRILDSLPGIGE